MHGIQSWIALPNENEETDPGFAHHGTADLPVFEEGGVWARLVAGEAFGRRSRVKTHSPLFYAHLELAAGSRTALPDREVKPAHVGGISDAAGRLAGGVSSSAAIAGRHEDAARNANTCHPLAHVPPGAAGWRNGASHPAGSLVVLPGTASFPFPVRTTVSNHVA